MADPPPLPRPATRRTARGGPSRHAFAPRWRGCESPVGPSASPRSPNAAPPARNARRVRRRTSRSSRLPSRPTMGATSRRSSRSMAVATSAARSRTSERAEAGERHDIDAELLERRSPPVRTWVGNAEPCPPAPRTTCCRSHAAARSGWLELGRAAAHPRPVPPLRGALQRAWSPSVRRSAKPWRRGPCSSRNAARSSSAGAAPETVGRFSRDAVIGPFRWLGRSCPVQVRLRSLPRRSKCACCTAPEWPKLDKVVELGRGT